MYSYMFQNDKIVSHKIIFVADSIFTLLPANAKETVLYEYSCPIMSTMTRGMTGDGAKRFLPQNFLQLATKT